MNAQRSLRPAAPVLRVHDLVGEETEGSPLVEDQRALAYCFF